MKQPTTTDMLHTESTINDKFSLSLSSPAVAVAAVAGDDSVGGETTMRRQHVQAALSTHPQEDAFYVCNLHDLVDKWNQFRAELPTVEPFYAMKCNPDPVVLQLLASLGAGFDCASKREIGTILECGVPAERIIYSNPCKQQSHIKYASSVDVKLMAFDNATELHKIKRIFPGARLVIRILVDDSSSLCQFGIKFGVDLLKVRDLLDLAWQLQLDVVGVSFHVGSGCSEPRAFYDAVAAAKKTFTIAEEVGFKLTLLDIGGGFPGVDSKRVTFKQTAVELNRAFRDFFPVGCGVRIIAEPGRYFVSSAYTLVTTIIAVREVLPAADAKTADDGYMYYVNDGVYGSFNCILYDHQHPTALPLQQPIASAMLHKCSVWGPTCDSMDCISMDACLPKLSVGSRLMFENMGAYTLAAGSEFNGFARATVVYSCGDAFWRIVRMHWPAAIMQGIGAPKLLVLGGDGAVVVGSEHDKEEIEKSFMGYEMDQIFEIAPRYGSFSETVAPVATPVA